MADVSSLPDWVQAGLAAFVASAGTFLAVRRKWSKDGASIAGDTAERDMMAKLAAERDAANTRAEKAIEKMQELMEQRILDAEKLARFDERMQHCDRESTRMSGEILLLKLQQRRLTAIIISLDPKSEALLRMNEGIEDPVDRRRPSHVIVDNTDPVPPVHQVIP